MNIRKFLNKIILVSAALFWAGCSSDSATKASIDNEEDDEDVDENEEEEMKSSSSSKEPEEKSSSSATYGGEFAKKSIL